MKKKAKVKRTKKLDGKKEASFNPEELEALLSAVYIYGQISEGTHEELAPLIEKMEKKLPKKIIEHCYCLANEELGEFVEARYQEGRDYQYNHDHRWDWKNRYIEVEPELEQMLIQCWQKRLTIWMEYPSSSENTITQREVDLYQIDGGYIRGFCHLRNEERTFRIDRIIAVRPTKKKYKMPSNVIHI